MGLAKQAKILSKQQQTAVLSYLSSTRYPIRNKVIFLLSVKAGLRAKEIAALTWGMVTDSEGMIDNQIALTNNASKGRSGGIVWINKELKDAIEELYAATKNKGEGDRVILSERGKSIAPQSIVNIFANWYGQLGFKGASSHSGRRTFITNAARKISSVGGSMRDVQLLARHSSLNMTMRYIEADVEAMKRVVNLI